jgi:hypothetical protein
MPHLSDTFVTLGFNLGKKKIEITLKLNYSEPAPA